MLRCYAILLCTTLTVPVMLFGQEQKSVRVRADEAYQRQEYAVAGSLYARIISKKKTKTSVDLLQRIALCNREIGQYDDAAFWYEKMQDRPDCPPVVHLQYGEILKSAGKYVEAKQQLAKFTSSKPDSILLRNSMIAGCDSAMAWRTNRLDMAMENIKELSSSGSDYVSGVTRQGLLLVSNGYRKMTMNLLPEKNPKIDSRTNQPYYKAYIFKQYSQGVANTFVEEVVPSLLALVPYHVGPVCFNAREDTIYVTLNSWQQDIANRKKRGPVNGERTMMVFWSVKTGDDWRPLEPLKEINSAGSSSGHVALSRDGKTMYFASNRKGGQGKMDIWFSEKQKNGRWGKPKNCGPVINTPFDEAFPTYNEEDMLYFSSKGHPGMGGFDLFRVAGKGSEWHRLQNLRYPFNSGGDDLGFIMKANMYEGYFSSNRTGGGGSDDIYRFMDTHFTERFNNDQGIQPYKDPEPGSTPNPVILAQNTPAKQTESVGVATKPDEPTVVSPRQTVSAPISMPTTTASTSTPTKPVEEPHVTNPRQQVTAPIDIPSAVTSTQHPVSDPVVAKNDPVGEPAKEPVKTTPTKRPPAKTPVKKPVKEPVVVAAPVTAPPVPETKTEEPVEKPVEKIETVAVAQPQPETKQEAEMSEMDHAIQNKMETMEFYYDYNSAILTTKSRNLLDRVAVVLNQYPDWKLQIRSYTDARGSDAYNKDLSALRCYAVIDYLVKKGVVSSRLYYENIGKDPADPCGKGAPCTDEQYMRARRTMLKIIHK
ncbi:OmpA family protein [Chitinophaga sp. S165]|uniref:OmpA family protein n=1 Tax=Chitinophaga sp. S165 TaxID=2135462 RepID=UPI000D70BD5A|nr:OmpA family protein [Chitinophaga sp. S165]PWV49659.1 outer membrane protein OmpA-like peptidoglycan-associated protein [Chitinophaga sp. S165]